jgi:hypothetical protein
MERLGGRDIRGGRRLSKREASQSNLSIYRTCNILEQDRNRARQLGSQDVSTPLDMTETYPNDFVAHLFLIIYSSESCRVIRGSPFFGASD